MLFSTDHVADGVELVLGEAAVVFVAEAGRVGFLKEFSDFFCLTARSFSPSALRKV